MLDSAKMRQTSFLLIKAAVYIRREELRKRVEKLAFALIEQSSANDVIGSIGTIAALQGLISVGRAMYEIEPINADAIMADLSYADTAMRQFAELSLPEKDGQEPEPKKSGKQQSAKTGRVADSEFGNYDEESANDETIDEQNAAKDDNPANRQSAILERMRQFGEKGAKLKDVIAAFPEHSERTLRYDLQRLCGQGVLERIGQGGPATYYKVRVI